MSSAKKQKKNVIIAALVAVVLFLGYVISQNVSFKTEWNFVEYNNGYKLVSYTQAFNDNSKEISIPAQYEGKDVVAIEDKAFYKNNKIEKVIIPDTVTELGSSVFKECKNLETVEMSKNISVMGGECFKDCKSLTAIILPDTLTEVRGETFMGCSSLKEVILPKNIIEIKGNTFENCSSLESIEIPSGVTRIAAHAFYGCTSLSNVFIPDTVNEIGSSAFRQCDSLESIELPEGVSINERAFKESPTQIRYKGDDSSLLNYETEIEIDKTAEEIIAEYSSEFNEIDDELSTIDSQEKIESLFVVCNVVNGIKIPDISTLDNSVWISETSRSDSWEIINTKKEILSFLKKAEVIGAKKVMFILDNKKVGESSGTIAGWSFEIDEVIDGYSNGDWTFDDAYELYAEEKAERMKKMAESIIGE